MSAVISTPVDLSAVKIAPMLAGVLTKPVAGTFVDYCVISEANLKINAKTVDIEQFCQGAWTAKISTSRSWELGVGNPEWAFADPACVIVRDAILNNTGVWIEFKPVGTGTGKPLYDGPINVSSWELQQKKGDTTKNPVGLMGSGSLAYTAQV